MLRKTDLLLEDGNFESLSPTDSILAEIHQAEAYVFSAVLCLGGSSMWKPSEKIRAGGYTTVNKADQTHRNPRNKQCLSDRTQFSAQVRGIEIIGNRRHQQS